MLFSLLYFLIHRLLGVGGRRADEKDIELLVLRHQVKVLQRQVSRPRLNRLDGVLFAAASRAMPRSGWSAFLVRPETLLRWHRELVRRKWTYRRMGQLGRPPIEPDARALIVRLGRENPRRGYQRIRGELLKLGISISATTVRTILLRAGLDPTPRRTGPTWTEFLRSQAAGILATDFFTVETIGLKTLYVLFFIELSGQASRAIGRTAEWRIGRVHTVAAAFAEHVVRRLQPARRHRAPGAGLASHGQREGEVGAHEISGPESGLKRSLLDLMAPLDWPPRSRWWPAGSPRPRRCLRPSSTAHPLSFWLPSSGRSRPT